MKTYSATELHLWFIEGKDNKVTLTADDCNYFETNGLDCCLNDNARELYLHNKDGKIKLTITDGWAIVEEPEKLDDGNESTTIYIFPREKVIRIWFDPV